MADTRHHLGMERVSLGRAKRIKTTDKKAMLVRLEGDPKTHWVPDFAVHDDSELHAGGDDREGELVVDQRWAEEKGLA